MKWRFRFGLRGLLSMVTACGAILGGGLYFNSLPPYPARQVELGMTRAEALEALGPPSYTSQTPWGECWRYGYRRLDLNLYFDPSGGDRCVKTMYLLPTDQGNWHVLMPDGQFVEEFP